MATWDGSTATLTFASADAVPDLSAGTILWGTSAGGYLGRIVTVATKGGDAHRDDRAGAVHATARAPSPPASKRASR